MRKIARWFYRRYLAPFTVEREWSIFVGWIEPVEVLGLVDAMSAAQQHVRRFPYGQAFVRDGHALRRDWWNEKK